MPSTIEIKHQNLTLWLNNRVAKQAAEAAANDNDTGPASRSDAASDETARPMSESPPRDGF